MQFFPLALSAGRINLPATWSPIVIPLWNTALTKRRRCRNLPVRSRWRKVLA